MKVAVLPQHSPWFGHCAFLADRVELQPPHRIAHLLVALDDSVRDVISVLLKEEGYNCVVATAPRWRWTWPLPRRRRSSSAT